MRGGEGVKNGVLAVNVLAVVVSAVIFTRETTAFCPKFPPTPKQPFPQQNDTRFLLAQ